MADGGLRQPEPGIPRRSTARRLDSGGVREAARRSSAPSSLTPRTAADYGWCASHSRYFWGFRLHAIFAPDGTPRALALTSPKRDEREIALKLIERCRRHGGATPDASSLPSSTHWTPRSSDPSAKTNPAEAHTSRRSPARTSSPSNDAEPAHSQASESAFCNAYSASPPPSPSTTNSADPAEHSSTTAPKTREINHLDRTWAPGRPLELSVRAFARAHGHASPDHRARSGSARDPHAARRRRPRPAASSPGASPAPDRPDRSPRRRSPGSP